MIDPGAAVQLADPVLTELITSVISSACAATARRAKKGLSDLRGGTEPLTNAQLVEMLVAPTPAEGVSLAALVALPKSSVSAHQLRSALESRPVAGVTQQLVCAILVNAPESTYEQIRNAFVFAVVEAVHGHIVEAEDFLAAAEELFELVRDNARSALSGAVDDPAREPNAEIFAQLTLIRAAMDRASSVEESLKRRQDSGLSFAAKEWKSRYRQQCAKHHGVITPPDFKERNTVKLDKIYVPARISGADDEAPDRHRSLYDIIDEIDRDVLVGDPGGGKSTTTHAIAYKLAETEHPLLPFVVVLREYALHSDGLSIVEYIERQLRTLYQAEAPKDLITTYLDAGEALVIFDGLDELLESSRRIAIAERIELFSSRFPLSKIYVTSRKVGYKEAKLDPQVFRVLELEGYSEAEVELYVSKWFSIQSNLNGVDTSEVQKSFIRESEAIPDLRRNPLLLALLCIIYRGQGYLPKHKVGIYEECSKLLFETWDKSRGLVFDFTFESYIQDALKHLAFWMWQKNDEEGVSEPRLVQELTSFFSGRAYETEDAAKRAAAEFVTFCSGRAWVLSEAGLTADHVPLFKFTHRTFMEYFAAIQVNRLNPEPKKLARYLLPKIAKNEWDTVGQLCIHLIHRSADQGGDVAISQMLKSSEQRSTTYRENVLDFIARCLSDLTVNPKLVKKVIRASVQNLRKARPSDGSFVPMSKWDSTSWRRLAHLETNHDVVREEFDSIVDELFAGDAQVDTEVAALLVIELSLGGGHPGLPLHGRQNDWRAFSARKLKRHRDKLLDLHHLRLYVGLELMAADALSEQEFFRLVRDENDGKLDFLFRPMAILVDSGVTHVAPLSAYLMSLGPNLQELTEVVDSISNRWLRLLRVLAVELVHSRPPLVNRTHVANSAPAWAWAQMWGCSVGEAEGHIDEWAAICVLVAVQLELMPPSLKDHQIRRRGDESMVSQMAAARANGSLLPPELLTTLSRSSDEVRVLVEDWAAGGVNLVGGQASEDDRH